MRTLLLEDDARLARSLVRGLTAAGHTVSWVSSLAEARGAIAASPFDLAIVDRMLPDGDGLELVVELRRASFETATLCLTARDRVADRVSGLEAGADDYLVKPFAFEELLARIGAVARRARVPLRIEAADVVVDTAAHRAWRAGTELILTPREFSLLCALASRSGTVMSREHLLREVWDTSRDPGTNVVEVYVRYLRTKLAAVGGTALIHTVRGVGYVFEARA